MGPDMSSERAFGLVFNSNKSWREAITNNRVLSVMSMNLFKWPCRKVWNPSHAREFCWTKQRSSNLVICLTSMEFLFVLDRLNTLNMQLLLKVKNGFRAFKHFNHTKQHRIKPVSASLILLLSPQRRTHENMSRMSEWKLLAHDWSSISHTRQNISDSLKDVQLPSTKTSRINPPPLLHCCQGLIRTNSWDLRFRKLDIWEARGLWLKG